MSATGGMVVATALTVNPSLGVPRVCAMCNRLIEPTDSRTTVGGVQYHSHCYDRSQRSQG